MLASRLEELCLTLLRRGFEGNVPALVTPIIALCLRTMWISCFEVDYLEEFTSCLF